MNSRVLGREIAAAGLQLADEPASVRELGGDGRARVEASQRDLEPVPGRVAVLEQHERAADRADRDVDIAVVVVVGRREAAPHDPRRISVDDAAHVLEPQRRPRPQVLEHLDRLGVPRQAPDRNRAVGDHEVRVSVAVEVGPGRAPAGQARTEDRTEVRAAVQQRPAAGAVEDRVLLVTGVRDEKVAPPVPVVVAARDAHPCVRVGHAFRRGPLLEPEAEPRRIGLRSARPRHVGVQAVRILVVGHVQVEPAVAVEVRERRPEAVVEAGRLEPRLPADLAESPVAEVQVEQVAHAGEVAGEAGVRVRDRRVQIGVAGDIDVGAAVAVHVRDRRARVPAGRGHPGCAGSLGEPPAALVPEQLQSRRRGDDQVRAAVAVEIRRRAAVAAHGQARVRPRGHVHEVSAHVAEQRAPRQSAALRPA